MYESTDGLKAEIAFAIEYYRHSQEWLRRAHLNIYLLTIFSGMLNIMGGGPITWLHFFPLLGTPTLIFIVGRAHSDALTWKNRYQAIDLYSTDAWFIVRAMQIREPLRWRWLVRKIENQQLPTIKP